MRPSASTTWKPAAAPRSLPLMIVSGSRGGVAGRPGRDLRRRHRAQVVARAEPGRARHLVRAFTSWAGQPPSSARMRSTSLATLSRTVDAFRDNRAGGPAVKVSARNRSGGARRARDRGARRGPRRRRVPRRRRPSWSRPIGRRRSSSPPTSASSSPRTAARPGAGPASGTTTRSPSSTSSARPRGTACSRSPTTTSSTPTTRAAAGRLPAACSPTRRSPTCSPIRPTRTAWLAVGHRERRLRRVRIGRRRHDVRLDAVPGLRRRRDQRRRDRALPTRGSSTSRS